MTKKNLWPWVERLVQEGHVLVVLLVRAGFPSACIDGDGQDLEEHLLRNKSPQRTAGREAAF